MSHLSLLMGLRVFRVCPGEEPVVCALRVPETLLWVGNGNMEFTDGCALPCPALQKRELILIAMGFR